MVIPLQTSIFGGLDWVAILNTGATGFAVVLLYISYNLISQTQKQVFEKDPADFNNLDVFRAWSGLVDTQVRQTRSFMILAGVFFFGGIGVLVYQHQAESEVLLSMRPYDQPFPRVFVQGSEGQFKEVGHAQISVRSGETIEVHATSAYDRLKQLEADVVRLEAQLGASREGLRATTVRSPLGAETGL